MPATVDSLYEQLFPLTTVMGQRFVENFSGDSLNTDRWGVVAWAGSPTSGMSDTVDGGYNITCTTSGDGESIGFGSTRTNGIAQYSYNSSATIFVETVSTNTNISVSSSGLSNEIRPDGAGNNASLHVVKSAFTYFTLRTVGVAGSQTDVSSSVTQDTAEHVVKIENKTSSVEHTLDGVLEGTSSTNLPVLALQPNFGIQSSATATVTKNIRYCEAYNT